MIAVPWLLFALIVISALPKYSKLVDNTLLHKVWKFVVIDAFSDTKVSYLVF
jgi:hypothetical protein